MAEERKKMEDANGYLKKLYEDKIKELEREVAGLKEEVGRYKGVGQNLSKQLEEEKANVRL